MYSANSAAEKIKNAGFFELGKLFVVSLIIVSGISVGPLDEVNAKVLTEEKKSSQKRKQSTSEQEIDLGKIYIYPPGDRRSKQLERLRAAEAELNSLKKEKKRTNDVLDKLKRDAKLRKQRFLSAYKRRCV